MSTTDLATIIETWAPRVVLAGVAIAAARYYFNGAQFREKVRADGKVAVVTGANCGLGKETARQLAKRGARVYLFCRSQQRAEEAINDLAKDGIRAENLIYLRCDLNDLASVREAAREFLSRESKLDILVNNAAVIVGEFRLTKDGHESAWQSNYLGHFLLTELLLPALEKSKDGRVVHVSAKLYEQVKELELEAIDDKRTFGWLFSYARSKLAQILNARELTKRLRAKGITNVTVNSCHPGVIQTNIGREGKSWWSYFIITNLIRPLTLITMKNTSSGVQTTLYLALSQKLAGASGKYYRDMKEDKLNKLAQDDDLAKRLYEHSRRQAAI